MSFHLVLTGLLAVLAAAPAAGRAGGAITDPLATAALLPQERQATLSCALPLPSGALSLAQAVDLALCNNPQTHLAWANVRAQAAQVGVARSNYLPSLDASLSATRNWANAGPSPFNEHRANAAVSYLLYDFGAREANLESSRQLLAAAVATDDSTVQAIFLLAIQAFYQVQQAIASLDAALQSERSSLENFKAADARYRAGSAVPADKLQAQTAYSQAVLARVQAEGALKNAQGVLANAMGFDAQTPLVLAAASEAAPPPQFERDVTALVEEARRRRPDLAAAHAQLRAAQAGVQAARSAGMPSVSLSASTGRSDESGLPASRGTSIGINLSIPLFSGFATAYRIRAAQAQAQASGAQLERLRLQVALDVWQAYQNLLTALQSVRATADLLASAEQSQRMAAGRYRAGVGTITDLLAAESALASARQQRAAALFNWNISRAALAQAMGQLDYGILQAMPDAVENNHPTKDQNK